MDKFARWGKRFWGVFVGLGMVAGFLAAVVQVLEYYDNRRPTPTPLFPSPSPSAAPTDTASPSPTLGPFQFLELPDQAAAGDDVIVTLQAYQGAVCYLEYYTPDGNLSTADGLGQAIADSQGRCNWEWHISANTQPGAGRLVISVGDIEETHEIQIVDE